MSFSLVEIPFHKIQFNFYIGKIHALFKLTVKVTDYLGAQFSRRQLCFVEDSLT